MKKQTLSPRMLYARAVFRWARNHPECSEAKFMEMLDEIERRIQQELPQLAREIPHGL